MSSNYPAVVARVRELARGRLPLAAAAALNALPDELKALADESTSQPEKLILADAAAAVQAHRGAIAAAFETGLVAIFDRKLRPPARAAAGSTDLGSLTLVDDAAIELEIALGRLVRKTTEEIDSEQLGGIGARLGELAGGAPLEGPANPLGPETVLEALRRACDAVPDPGPVRMALVNSLQPHLALALRKLYREVNDLLIAEGVLPRIRRHVQRAPDSMPAARAPTAASSRAPAPAAPKSPGMPPGMTLSQAMSLKDLLPGATGSPIDVGAIVAGLLEGPPATRQYGARMLANPEGSLFARAMMMPVGRDLLAQLSQLQGAATADGAGGPGDLNAVVDHLARTDGNPLDRLTGELVAVVFDFLLHERDLPDPVKVEIARLQIVAFKAALLDRRFFARREHPLRALLQAITDAGTDPAIDARAESRFIGTLHAILGEVLTGFEEDLAIFDAARARLAALVAEVVREGDEAVEVLAAGLAEQERAAEVRARAMTEVAKRAGVGTPSFVERFLVDAWAGVLADAGIHGRAGDESWDARLALVDDLVWSVAPKQARDVARLTAMLPKLVPALKRGMQTIDLPAHAQAAFLDELMRTHAASLQAARSKRPPPPPAVAPPAPPSEVFAAPELALDARPVLERGAMVEFAEVDPPVRARLAWISPGQTVYLFTASGASARQLSRRDLSDRIRAGSVRIVGERGAVIDRALAAVVGEPGS